MVEFWFHIFVAIAQLQGSCRKKTIRHQIENCNELRIVHIYALSRILCESRHWTPATFSLNQVAVYFVLPIFQAIALGCPMGNLCLSTLIDAGQVAEDGA